MPADHELPKWEQLAKSVTDDPLKQARDVANKWVTILSALVGLSTVFGLVQGRDALSKLSPVFQFILVLAFVLTLAVSVRAIYLAALASEGSSGAVPLDKDNFIAWYTKSLIEALNQITQSRRMALLGSSVAGYRTRHLMVCPWTASTRNECAGRTEIWNSSVWYSPEGQ